MQFLKVRMQFQHVQIVQTVWSKNILTIQSSSETGPNLYISEFACSLLQYVSKQHFEVICPLHQRFTVIRKRQRDQPWPGQPTVYVTEYDTMCQRCPGRIRRETYR